MKAKDLKPCPFCGGQPIFVNNVRVGHPYGLKCVPCDYTLHDDRRDKVESNWNNRLPLSPVEGVTVPYCCPVCVGCGTVGANFYSQMTIGTSASREQCKSCNGTGIIFSPNPHEIKP